MKFSLFLIFTITFLLSNANAQFNQKVSFDEVKKNISYENDIKPILDKRCVVCHSCYNSPCQLKMSSLEGLLRGATKEVIYKNRLKAGEMTRLFVDATTTEKWREKGFYPVNEKIPNLNASIMSYLLNQKQKFPKIKGNYAPEDDELTCIKDKDELEKYLNDKPYHGMPYGFPALKEEEHNLLMTWLDKGIKKPKIIQTKEPKEIKIFEDFLNNQDVKHKVTARYIYEHLFLAHIKFPDSNDFYELVRSYTKPNTSVKVIATRLPYDKVEEPFYYRFQKIKSTIVHKTHMVYNLDESKLKRYKDLFINTNWEAKPTLVSYDSKIAANPLTAYEQIPATSKYNFLLDNIHYFIMTFIRGPVCKGQIALNVINDHFWVAFKDPKFDVTLHDSNFIHDNLKKLSVPNEYGPNAPILDAFDFFSYDQDTIAYYKNKNELYKKYYKKGIDINSIWKGNNSEEKNNDAILTIYRHFNSASVQKGALGDIPKTMWVIDYPLLERLYYSLVVGFDVFGNTPHKLLVRKYMDRLRIEGESNFLEYLPKDIRKTQFDKWYLGYTAKWLITYTPSQNETLVKYKSKEYKKELMLDILKYTNTPKDKLNFIEKGYKQSPILKQYNTKSQIEQSLKDLTLKKNTTLFRDYSSNNFNLSYLRIQMNNKEDYVYSIVINKWHDNVAFLFNESERLDSSKDRINILKGFVGSYPNLFIVVKQDDLSEFFNILINYKKDDNEKLSKYFISRENKNFWEVYDWFQNEFNKEQPIDSGIFDLNRYFKKSILPITN